MKNKHRFIMGQAKSRYRGVVEDVLQDKGDIRLLTRDDEQEALCILVKAFENNDAFLWMVREDNLSEDEARAR